MNRIALVVVVIIEGLLTSISLGYSGGSGTSQDPYQIATKADLEAVGGSSYFILTADINLAGTTYNNSLITSFNGSFDGNGHKILNLSIDTQGAEVNNLGLFGSLSTWGYIKNLGIEAAIIKDGNQSYYIGGLAGYISTSTIENCYTVCDVNTGVNSSEIGGLVGHSFSSTITDCHTDGNICGGSYLGGLVGNNYNGNVITACHATGSVSGGKDSINLGGLTGYNFNSTIANCYADSNISGGSYLGGLVGNNYNGNVITACHATGSVSGGKDSINLGGLTGYNFDSTIANCYADGNISNGSYLGGLVGYGNGGSVNKCYAIGSISGDNNSLCLGGLVGYNFSSTIVNCYANSNISGGNYIGGLVGNNRNSDVNACYAIGSVSGGKDSIYWGGLIGYYIWGTISNSYFLDTAGPNNGYGTPLTDEQMKQQSSFINWDFNDVWHICENTNYPKFIWQISPADLTCPDGVNFIDYAFFAERWLNTNCAINNNCDGADFDFSGRVDIEDLAIMCDHWLEGF